jgi:hypothetical protein
MRTSYLLFACALVAACDRGDRRAIEGQRKPVESTKGVSVDPHPKPDPSVDNRNAPAVDQNTTTHPIDLEQERSTLAHSIELRTEQLDAKIDELERRGGANAKDAVATLRAKRDQARAKLGELHKTSRDNWEPFKRDVLAAWNQLERDVNEATRSPDAPR